MNSPAKKGTGEGVRLDNKQSYIVIKRMDEVKKNEVKQFVDSQIMKTLIETLEMDTPNEVKAVVIKTFMENMALMTTKF
jgi:predicted peroxiredoxin